MDINTVFKKYDPKTQAKWYTYQDGGDFLIAPMDNPLQQKAATKVFTLAESMRMEAHGPEGLEGMAADAIAKIYRVYAESLVIDWREIKDGDKELKFDSKKVHEWMTDHSEFANFVIGKAVELAGEIRKENEELAKNSESM